MGLVEALRNYKPADEDGTMVLVSRQACDEAADEIERLRGLLAEAAECISDWGAYADNYFQHKHDLEADVKRFKEASLMTPNAELTGAPTGASGAA